MNFSETFLEETARIAGRIDREAIERLADLLAGVRDGGGRVFFLGVGGSAANASHAVNDFRKLAGIEAYAPTDNVSELSARINDEGWDSSYAEWLKGSRISAKDAVVILSVGGGDPERGVSLNLVRAIETAKAAGAGVCGIVGREGGATAAAADACVIIPPLSADRVTPHTESFQSVVLHLLVSHPRLQISSAKWESLK